MQRFITSSKLVKLDNLILLTTCHVVRSKLESSLLFLDVGDLTYKLDSSTPRFFRLKIKLKDKFE